LSIKTQVHSGTVTPVVKRRKVIVIVPIKFSPSILPLLLICFMLFWSSFNLASPSSLPPAALIILKFLNILCLIKKLSNFFAESTLLIHHNECL
jgi:hypothetical protein